jgi:hypothetical protein
MYSETNSLAEEELKNKAKLNVKKVKNVEIE